MKTEGVYHLCYLSTACDNLDINDFKEIVAAAQSHNEECGVTGILIYCNKHFFQILEGDKEDVLSIYSRLLVDYRHDNLIKLQEGFIPKRQFEEWSMAFKSYNCELQQLDDFNNESFYSHINYHLHNTNHVSLKILADFFDLNGNPEMIS